MGAVLKLAKTMVPSKIRNLYTCSNIKLGRIVYGNVANFSNNYVGTKRWEQNRRLHAPHAKVQADVKELKETGVASFHAGFPKQVIADIYKEYLEVIEKPNHCIFKNDKGVTTTQDEGKYYTSLKRPIEDLPSLRRLLTPELQEFLKQYYESDYTLYSINAWRTKHISQEHLDSIYPQQPYSILWHVDGHPIDTLKIFIVLSDVSEEDGPFHYLTMQRTEEIKEKGYLSRFKYNIPQSEIESPDHLRKLIGSSGTASFCNTTRCLHRAGVPAAGHMRDILQLRFESSAAPLVFPTSSEGYVGE